MKGGGLHLVAERGGRARLPSRSAPSGARMLASLATAMVHMLVVGALLLAGGGREMQGDEVSTRLILVPLRAPPAVVPFRENGGDERDLKPDLKAVAAASVPIVRVAEAGTNASVTLVANAPVAGPEPATPAPGVPIAAASSPDEGLRAYEQLLWRHIAASRPRGVSMKGRVLVRFALDRGGRVLASAVEGSSANLNLDRIALRTIRLASPMPAPPAALPDAALEFVVPIEFR